MRDHLQDDVETTGAEAPAPAEEEEREETPWTRGDWPPGL